MANPDDLSGEYRLAVTSLRELHALELALEGKYVDFRISRSLPSMNFVFDRGGQALYRIAAKPVPFWRDGESMVFQFSKLQLQGRDKYRLILCADRPLALGIGDRIPVEMRINEGSGFSRPVVRGGAEVRVADQQNVEFDFDAPDVPTITDLRVGIPAQAGLRIALLFVRYRLYVNTGVGPSAPEMLGREQVVVAPSPLGTAQAPWERPNSAAEPRKEAPAAPPRRRRLE